MPATPPHKTEYNHRYYAENRDALREKQAAYYRQNAEKIKARVAANRLLNPENPEAHAARSRDYYQRKREESPTYYAEKRANRRALEAAAQVGEVDYDAILAEFGQNCHLCEEEIPQGDLHFDHVVPLCRGGAHSTENLRPAHSRCNRSKGARLMEELA